MSFPGFSFHVATLARSEGIAVLSGITWTVQPGEAWAVVGSTASGKTTLLEAVQGKHRVVAGTHALPMGTTRLVAFQEESRTFSYAGHYYQQRYEFADSDEPLSVEQFLLARTPATVVDARAAAASLGIADHLGQPFLTLSNGQTRRARIAKALLAQPDWLLLDDPFVGIDTPGRTELAARLGTLLAAGKNLVLATAPEWVPDWVTHVLQLEAGQVVYSGPRSGWGGAISPELATADSLSPADRSTDTQPIIELQNVTVKHGGRVILDDVNWTVRTGERWAILGPNGAGKTTLLALTCGDHPQAFSNRVTLFGVRRGSGETIWEIKRRIGFVSPEFHLYFREPLTAFEAAATAFGDSLLYREPTPEQDKAIRSIFLAFGCEQLLPRKFSRLSVGQQRLVLLVRAVVKSPALLILDEPFQGLDTATTNRIRNWLDATLQPEQTLVFVTHVPAHLPKCVTRELHLAGGRVVAAGFTSRHPRPRGLSSPG